MRIPYLSVMLFCLAASFPGIASAQDDIRPGGDRMTLGVGAAFVSSYIGSNTGTIVPMAAVQGQVSGLSFSSQGTSLSVDLVPDGGKPGWKLQLGPVAMLRLDRSGMIGNKAVAALGKLDKAWEVGGWVGIQRTGVVTSPYDNLSASLSWQHDVGNAHGSSVVSPSLDYGTPLSKTSYASVSLSADHVGKGFGAYYFDVDAAGSAASGLPVYDGAIKAGWKDWNTSLLAAHSLTGNLTHGLGIFATAGYARLLGAYRRSPIVSVAGSPNQLSGALGIAYTF
jgi:outer membrane protein